MKFLVVLFSILAVVVAKSSRIINGGPAEEGQFPWQVAVKPFFNGVEYFCGGSLISDQWVLTAAQCVYGATSFTLKFGSIYSSGNEDGSVTVETTTAIIHEGFNSRLNNDVALIKLDEPIEFTDRIQPIRLPSKGDYLPIIKFVNISGWGSTDDNKEISNTLNYVELVTLQMSDCSIYYGHEIAIDSTLCCGGLNQSPCYGDFGGPLVFEEDEGFTLHGVISFVPNAGCALDAPTGYVRTESMLDWIASKTGLKVNE